MGVRGPVGKRSDQRLGHRAKSDQDAVTKVPASVVAVDVPAVDESWHQLAKDWFASLATSGQVQFFEPSDWMTAKYVAEAMSRNLNTGRFSAQLFAAVMSGMSSLLTTEGDRRRIGIELQRDQPADPAELVVATDMDAYRARIADAAG